MACLCFERLIGIRLKIFDKCNRSVYRQPVISNITPLQPENFLAPEPGIKAEGDKSQRSAGQAGKECSLLFIRQVFAFRRNVMLCDFIPSHGVTAIM